MEITFAPTPKQFQAWNYLNDSSSTEIYYGGGAGGGKSLLGCAWLIISCLRFPETRYLMGRAILKSLKESTLLTFFGLCKQWGLKADEDYRYNSIDGVIKFKNGSEIYLKDLFLYPSDPEFDSLGSTEFTGAFIDECSQVSLKAKNIVMSRLRYKLVENNIVPKLLMASNPAKNFLFYEFYKPHKDGTLPDFRKFVPALVSDNPHISPHYIENLKKLDKVSRERLLYGNFEYDSDPSKLIEYDNILNMFTNTFVPEGEKYISADIALMGNDKLVIIIWSGLRARIVKVQNKSDAQEIEKELLRIAEEYQIPRSNIIVDSDGVGSYLTHYLPGIRSFHGGGAAFKKNDYYNARSECYFKLAELVTQNKIYLQCDESIKQDIISELEQIKRDKVDNDEQKLRVIKKELIKEKIGRSPDFSDALMMRMWFECMTDSNSFTPLEIDFSKIM